MREIMGSYGNTLIMECGRNVAKLEGINLDECCLGNKMKEDFYDPIKSESLRIGNADFEEFQQSLTDFVGNK